jgi:hypothetical protein
MDFAEEFPQISSSSGVPDDEATSHGFREVGVPDNLAIECLYFVL